MAFYLCRFDSPARVAERLARGPRREYLPPDFKTLSEPIEPPRNPWIGPLVFSYGGPFSTKVFGTKDCDIYARSDRFFLTFEDPNEAADLAGDHPPSVIDVAIDERSVLWRVTVAHHADGSCREVVRDVPLREARLSMLALLGMKVGDPQIKASIESRLCDALGPVEVPSGLDWHDCCEYPMTSYGFDNFKPGIVDSLI